MPTITIGRSSSCNIVIPDERVSRVHAELTEQNGRYIYHDLSKNGSSLNGRLLRGAAVTVSPGDPIMVANRFPLPWAQVYALLPSRPGHGGGVTIYDPPQNPSTDDSLGIGWSIMAVLMPIVGFICYFAWKSTSPHRANTIGLISIISLLIDTLSTLSLFAM